MVNEIKLRSLVYKEKKVALKIYGKKKLKKTNLTVSYKLKEISKISLLFWHSIYKKMYNFMDTNRLICFVVEPIFKEVGSKRTVSVVAYRSVGGEPRGQ